MANVARLLLLAAGRADARRPELAALHLPAAGLGGDPVRDHRTRATSCRSPTAAARPTRPTWATRLHRDVHARRPAAPRRQHALPVDLRQQRRGRHGPREVRALLPARRARRARCCRSSSARARRCRRSAPPARSRRVLGGYILLFPRAKVVTVIFIIFFFTILELPALLVLGIWFLAAGGDGLLRPRPARRRRRRRRRLLRPRRRVRLRPARGPPVRQSTNGPSASRSASPAADAPARRPRRPARRRRFPSLALLVLALLAIAFGAYKLVAARRPGELRRATATAPPNPLQESADGAAGRRRHARPRRSRCGSTSPTTASRSTSRSRRARRCCSTSTRAGCSTGATRRGCCRSPR